MQIHMRTYHLAVAHVACALFDKISTQRNLNKKKETCLHSPDVSRARIECLYNPDTSRARIVQNDNLQKKDSLCYHYVCIPF